MSCVMFFQCTCALNVIFQTEEAEDVVKEMYPTLLSAILLRISSTLGTKPPRVARVNKIISFFKKFFNSNKTQHPE